MKSIAGFVIDFVHRLRNGIKLSTSSYQDMVDAVNQQSEAVAELSDHQLRDRFNSFRELTEAGVLNPTAVTELFAIAREASTRALAIRPFDVQLLAAFAIHDRRCVQMQTGEGKTLAAALVVCVRALSGRGVHVLTYNDYLAERDAQWMGPLFEFLNLSVGHVGQTMNSDQRRQAYSQDITYVTAKEAGFDYLRDQMCTNTSDQVQRGFSFAVVDEADSILIDEARVPLVIATAADQDETDLSRIADLIRPLDRGVHYELKSGGRNVSLTERGLQHLERQLGVSELHSESCSDLLSRLNQALHAQVLLTRDVDYIVRDESIALIDEFTGRVAENRKWPGGLQAALEAKEGVTVQPEGRILNTVTLQHFLECYDGLAGMTGTAIEGTDELDEFYNLKVVIIPPNRPCIRTDHEDRIFTTKPAKHAALVQDISQQHRRGRPVLIGTASVEESQALAGQLAAVNIKCRVLNAANDHLEAEIIAEAGAAGAVTISTNMAGRGTDIRLGGSDEASRDSVLRSGGLYVVGTNRHESRRIDNQLRGRSGRQGDPGESRFFVSLQDDLIVRHGVANLLREAQHKSESAASEEQIGQRIAHVQRVIEGECFEIRRTLRSYSFLPEVQRKKVGMDRQRLLDRSKTSSILKRHDPELHQALRRQWGAEIVDEAERDVTLAHLNWCWSDHLAHAAELREGIHLVSLGGFNALDTFNKELNLEFEHFRSDLEDRVVETLSTAKFTERGIDLPREGLNHPSSTWTFMINDNPRGAVLNQLLNGIASRLKKAIRSDR